MWPLRWRTIFGTKAKRRKPFMLLRMDTRFCFRFLCFLSFFHFVCVSAFPLQAARILYLFFICSRLFQYTIFHNVAARKFFITFEIRPSNVYLSCLRVSAGGGSGGAVARQQGHAH